MGEDFLKKVILVVLICLMIVCVVFASGCINPFDSQKSNASVIIQQAIPTDSPSNTTQTTNIPRQTYNNNEISFNYPTSWEMVPAEKIVTIHADPNYKDIVAVSPRGEDPTLVSFQRTVSNAKLANEVSRKKQDIQNSNGQVLSERNLTLDSVPAIALTYEYPDHQYRFLAVHLQKNDIVYIIVLGARKTEFANHAGNFEMILNSFHVK
jgi:flagellar basal body-associated protein FliL